MKIKICYRHFYLGVTKIGFNLPFRVTAVSLKRTSPIVQHHRPSKISHFDDTVVPSDVITSGHSVSGIELMSPEINSLTADERNQHIRHRNDDGEYLRI